MTPTATHGDLLVRTIENGLFGENCYIAADGASGEALLIDPGSEEARLLDEVRAMNVEVVSIVCTHAHIDHVGAVAPLKRLLGAPFALHADDAALLPFAPQQAQMFGLPPVETPEVERALEHGDTLEVGGLSARVLHTPGHSPGGCCLLFAGARVLFAGDTLFAGSIGRTDLPGGSTETLLQAIHGQLLTLDEATVVYPGHGPATTIGAEKAENPFLQPGGFGF